MGSLTPTILTGLNDVTRIVGTVAPLFGTASDIVGSVRSMTGNPEEERRQQLRAQQDLMLRQLQQKQKVNAANAADQAALERERLAADAQAADEQRRAAPAAGMTGLMLLPGLCRLSL